PRPRRPPRPPPAPPPRPRARAPTTSWPPARGPPSSGSSRAPPDPSAPAAPPRGSPAARPPRSPARRWAPHDMKPLPLFGAALLGGYLAWRRRRLGKIELG